jgi:hypothetical protein
MMSRDFVQPVLVAIALLFLPAITIAQSQPSYVSGLSDPRFNDVVEDWTSPALTKTHLHPVRPMIGFVNEESGYSVSLIRVQWRRNDPIDLWLMMPKGVKKPPVILYLYGYPSDTDIFKNPKWQEFTTKGGFAAAGFVTALTGHRYHDIGWKYWFVSELQQCLADSAHDVQMVLDYLASRGDLDMDRVGVFGQLSGASITILAAAADPRIKVLDVLDPWGDWPTWMEKSPFVPRTERPDYVKPEFLNNVALLEPVDWLSKVQAKKVRLQQRNFENETPLASKEKLQRAVPAGATVVLYKTNAEFDNAIGPNGDNALDWMKKAVKSLPPPAPEATVVAGKSN